MTDQQKTDKQAILTGEEAATAIVKVGIGTAGAIIAAHNPVAAAVVAPFVASLVAEFYGVVVPKSWRERQKRLEQAISGKAATLPDEKAALLESRVREAEGDPAVSGILEEGFWAAGRAGTQQRIEYIAAVLVHGISQDDADNLLAKRILSLLDELDDVEILIMLEKAGIIGWMRFFALTQEYFEKTVAVGDRTEKHNIADGLYENFVNHLVNVDLLEPVHSRMGENLNLSGSKAKPSRYRLTKMGAVLLRVIDAERSLPPGTATYPSIAE